jgi:hypothetical protein
LLVSLFGACFAACGDSVEDPQVKVDANSASALDISDTIFVLRDADCAAYADQYVSFVRDIQRATDFDGHVEIAVADAACELSSNSIPNHDFNDATARFATDVTAIPRTFSIPRDPVAAAATTQLELRSYDAIMLNGVVLDLLAAGCYGVGDGMIGCFDLGTPWRSDPMFGVGGFGTDAHHAHTQPDGTYHYHGGPLAMYDDNPGANGSPVIGFAADGFPIFGPYFFDGTLVRKAVSGYQLRSGTRPDGPGGSYDGQYVDDYEFTSAGDLDACNGMEVDGVYGYYVTDSYPWVVACFHGTPDPSFAKQGP